MKKAKKGFTLIEMLVVISIIGILAALTLVSYSGAQKQARDTERRSDLNQYRNGLESFAASKNGAYPVGSAVGDICGTGLDLEGYLATCPTDPTGGTGYGYQYQSDDGSSYTLWGLLETGLYWKICSSGQSGKSAINGSDCSDL
ncbi:MAG TPA: type II secretion system protein [Candidatus Bathyarchaeia archaeon]|nr:type II secretion system protein [Candidatus Bathyarchaeia archaeon]